ncbi:hypothetical protein sscle_06g053160 [Sclerotinia sclerotiorum 1980 UF-70]|uniref:Steroid 5-alpha reductase C-terminal domain-containing protein n=1 Tax=Sclerotinia sclerotiorum (strain ATCC 18683 / 1980 / Ss-1) TaxID=665079 RepID=A0A1D9Q6N2_SCLS1|nr:hypothetical protein sscle_06g053160 [Sclerotinia sclerotiorum 1980 UF-70]
MTLPVIKTIEDCSNITKTVLPYLPQLYDLPQQILQSYSNPTELRDIYLATNPLISAFAFSLFLAPVFLLVSEVNKNYSQVDRCWSILPTIYNAHFTIYAHLCGLPTGRLDNVLAFSTIWSLRLTFNYWRKGGYNIGSEDYRWEVLRNNIPPPLFFVFNVTFISLAQSILLFLVATPSYVMLLAARHGAQWTTADLIFSRGLVTLVVLEYFADGQQWNYQTAKQQYLKTAKVQGGFDQESLDRGFVTSGLWSLSRHPNFAAEQTIWVVLYMWGCWTSEVVFNWTFVGAMSYLVLFQGSTWFTELITAKKYPDYQQYQARVGKFLPNIFSTGPVFAKAEKKVATAVKGDKRKVSASK